MTDSKKRHLAVVGSALCLAMTVLSSAQSIRADVSLDDAARKIIQQDDKKVLATKTEEIDGKKVHIIKVLSADGRIQHLKIDAQTGQRIK